MEVLKLQDLYNDMLSMADDLLKDGNPISKVEKWAFTIDDILLQLKLWGQTVGVEQGLVNENTLDKDVSTITCKILRSVLDHLHSVEVWSRNPAWLSESSIDHSHSVDDDLESLRVATNRLTATASLFQNVQNELRNETHLQRHERLKSDLSIPALSLLPETGNSKDKMKKDESSPGSHPIRSISSGIYTSASENRGQKLGKTTSTTSTVINSGLEDELNQSFRKESIDLGYEIDPSLFRLEAPEEFERMKRFLSPKSLQKAESGDLHQTARRLGALFEPLLPNTTHLISSYGRRVLEVLGELHLPGKDSEQSGIAGIAIWAAATSGPASVQVYLLACMIAKLWSAPAAVSIWCELVADRRSQIREKSIEFGMPSPSKFRGQIHFSVEAIENWDNSARSWLEYADKAKAPQQTKLAEVMNDLPLTVKYHILRYGPPETVWIYDAWLAALTGFENIIEGVPLRTTTEVILLACSAWHIFPDLVQVGQRLTHVNQRDVLIQSGGLLTLGLNTGSSLTWSFPLWAQKWYDNPMRLQNEAQAGFSIDQFLHIILGSIFGSWDVSSNKADLIHCAARLVDLLKHLDSHIGGFQSPSFYYTWPDLLTDAAKKFIRSEGPNRSKILDLLAFGRRCSPFFFGQPSTPFLGISDLSSRISNSNDQTETEKSQILQWVSSLEGTSASIVTALRAIITIVAVFKHQNPVPRIFPPVTTNPCITDMKWLVSVLKYPDNLSQPMLRQSKWGLDRLFLPFKIGRREVFSCLAAFSFGNSDIDPTVLDPVFGFSAAGNFYAPKLLLHRQSIHLADYPSSRYVHAMQTELMAGRLNRHQFVFLALPSQLLCHNPNLEVWKSARFHKVTGETENHFSKTSLHIALTGFETTVPSSKASSDVPILETVVSAFDAGDWLADLDILKSTERSIPYLGYCRQHDDKYIPRNDIIAIESWNEFLQDPPNNCKAMVFHASANWQAQFAAMTMSVAREYVTIVMEFGCCWHCIQPHIDQLPNGKRLMVIA